LPIYLFDEFEADVGALQLRRAGEPIQLQEKPFQLLVALLESPGQIVSRTDLRQRLWPDEEYGQFDDSLNTAVLKLRRALDDSVSEPQFIETVPRRGYRWLFPVKKQVGGDSSGEERGSGEPPGGTRLPGRSKVGTASLALVATLVVLILWFGLRREAVPFSERDWILITEFENVSGDEVFDRSLRTALITGVRQSRYVNVLPDARISDSLRRMGKDPEIAVTEEIAAEIAAREGIRVLLVGSVAKIGDTYELAARLVDSSSHTDLAVESARAGHRDQVINAVDELVEQVRRRLGESAETISRGRVQLPQATTSSLEALKLFADATTVLRQADYAAAVAALERAIELDPDFAAAHAVLGAHYYSMHDREKGEIHFAKALSEVGRLTYRERLWFESEVEGWRGNSDSAIQRYEQFVAEYPDADLAWFRLGYQYLAVRQCDQVERVFRRVLELNPASAGAHINLATCLAISGRYEEAVRSYEQAFEIRPDRRNRRTLREFATVLVLAGRTKKAREVFEGLAASDGGGDRAMGHRGLAFLALRSGQFAEAVQHFEEAIELHQKQGEVTAELRVRTFSAWTLAALGRVSGYQLELETIEKYLIEGPVEPYFSGLAGWLLAMDGRASALNVIHGRVARAVNEGNPYDRAGLHLIQGELALVGGDLENATREFELAMELQREPQMLAPLAYAATKRGDIETADRMYREIMVREWFGYEAQLAWMWAPYELGQILESAGDLGGAVDAYSTFVYQFAAAESGVTDLEHAAARLEILRGASISRP
jgi:tetratricopeptide (TPR) repeat protein/DNA-binding winged helix-turn-helix (wHTH) protein